MNEHILAYKCQRHDAISYTVETEPSESGSPSLFGIRDRPPDWRTGIHIDSYASYVWKTLSRLSSRHHVQFSSSVGRCRDVGYAASLAWTETDRVPLQLQQLTFSEEKTMARESDTETCRGFTVLMLVREEGLHSQKLVFRVYGGYYRSRTWFTD